MLSVVVGSEGFEVVDELGELGVVVDSGVVVELEVGGVWSFSPNPSPEPDSNLTSRVKLRGSGKLVAFHVKVL